MSRRNGNGEQQSAWRPWTEEESQAIEQSLDMEMIAHVQELLCTLWQQSRISLEARTAGESALSAAAIAVEQPQRRQVTTMEGLQVSNQQWLAKQRSNDRDF